MATYRRLWTTSVILLLIPGLLLAIISFSPEAMAGITLLSVLVAWMLRRTVNNGSAVPGPHYTGHLKAALAAAAATLAITGWINSMGGYGALLALTLAASSPPAVLSLAHLLSPAPEDSAARPGHLGPSIEVIHTWDAFLNEPLEVAPDEVIITTWRRSFGALARCKTLTERAAIAEARCQCLNELERRYPDGFEKWLSEGARAGSDPSRYLRPRTARDPDG